MKFLIVLSETAIIILLSKYNGWTSIADLYYGKIFLLFVLSGLLGTDAVILFSSLIKDTKISKFFERFGKHSIIIFLTHYYICREMIPKFAQWTNTYDYLNKLWVQVVITVLISVAYYPLVGMYDRYITKRKLKIINTEAVKKQPE